MSSFETYLMSSPNDFVTSLEKLMTAAKFADHIANVKNDDSQYAATKRKSLLEYAKFPENNER